MKNEIQICLVVLLIAPVVQLNVAADEAQILAKLSSDVALPTDEARELIKQLQGDKYKVLIDAGEINEKNCNDQFYERVFRSKLPIVSNAIHEYVLGRLEEHKQYCYRQYLTRLRTELEKFNQTELLTLSNSLNDNQLNSRHAVKQVPIDSIADKISSFAASNGLGSQQVLERCHKLATRVEQIQQNFATAYTKDLPEKYGKFVIASAVCDRVKKELTEKVIEEQLTNKEIEMKSFSGLMSLKRMFKISG